MDAVVKSTTARIPFTVYEAIDIAKPSGLNGAPDLNVKDPNIQNPINQRKRHSP